MVSVVAWAEVGTAACSAQTSLTPIRLESAATEELCENVAKLVVDATGGPYTSSSTSCANGDGLLTKFVEQVMGLNPSDTLHDGALMILENHCGLAAKVKTSTTGGGLGGGTTSTSAQTN